ncbi:hypothetical protein Mapa_011017 [Marchantia paleacea]|nr:hypothetical protein Mapa_011017 [Marchantia paleacea]
MNLSWRVSIRAGRLLCLDPTTDFIYTVNRRSRAHGRAWETYMLRIFTASPLWNGSLMAGCQFVIGGLCGNVDIYDACLRQYRYQGKFEFTYITRSQAVCVSRLSSDVFRRAIEPCFVHIMGEKLLKSTSTMTRCQ